MYAPMHELQPMIINKMIASRNAYAVISALDSLTIYEFVYITLEDLSCDSISEDIPVQFNY